MARESDLAPNMALLKARYGVGAMSNSDMQEALSQRLYHLTQVRPLEGHETKRLGNPMSKNMRDEVV